MKGNDISRAGQLVQRHEGGVIRLISGEIGVVNHDLHA